MANLKISKTFSSAHVLALLAFLVGGVLVVGCSSDSNDGPTGTAGSGGKVGQAGQAGGGSGGAAAGSTSGGTGNSGGRVELPTIVTLPAGIRFVKLWVFLESLRNKPPSE